MLHERVCIFGAFEKRLPDKKGIRCWSWASIESDESKMDKMQTSQREKIVIVIKCRSSSRLARRLETLKLKLNLKSEFEFELKCTQCIFILFSLELGSIRIRVGWLFSLSLERFKFNLFLFFSQNYFSALKWRYAKLKAVQSITFNATYCIWTNQSKAKKTCCSAFLLYCCGGSLFPIPYEDRG